jgi:hypothetical protein
MKILEEKESHRRGKRNLLQRLTKLKYIGTHTCNVYLNFATIAI